MPNNIEEWFKNLPPITRAILLFSSAASLAVTFDLVTPFDLYLNYSKIREGEPWRLLTPFFYLGKFGIQCVFNLFLLYSYGFRLEEHLYHGRSGDFLFMLLFGMFVCLVVTPLLGLTIPFLAGPLLMFMMYVWARNNPFEHVRIFMVFTVTASWLPYVFLGFSLLFGNSITGDLLGIGVGHVFFFGNFVLKKRFDFTLFPTPSVLSRWLNDTPNRLEVGEDDDEDIILEEGEGLQYEPLGERGGERERERERARGEGNVLGVREEEEIVD